MNQMSPLPARVTTQTIRVSTFFDRHRVSQRMTLNLPKELDGRTFSYSPVGDDLVLTEIDREGRRNRQVTIQGRAGPSRGRGSENVAVSLGDNGLVRLLKTSEL